MVEKQKSKNVGVALLLAFFLYPLAIGYFYLGKTKKALIWLGFFWGAMYINGIFWETMTNMGTNTGWVFMITGWIYIIIFFGVFYTMFDCYKITKSMNQDKRIAEEKEKIAEEKENSQKRKAIKPIIEKFNKRYFTYEQRIEHIEDLTNLINHKLKSKYETEEINEFFEYFEKEHNIDLFDKEISKLKNKNANNLAKVLIRLSPETNFEYDEYLLNQFTESLERKNIEYNIEDLKQELLSEFKSIKAMHFEKKLSRNQDKRITVEEIEHLDGFQFEELIGELFRKMGYEVNVTKKSGDQGADLIVEKDGVSTAIQTKKYAGNVGNTAVQEVVAAMKYYDCDKCMVITTGKFTKCAFELAGRNGVQLIDKKGLNELFDSIL